MITISYMLFLPITSPFETLNVLRGYSAGRMLQATAYYPSGTPHRLSNTAVATEVNAATDHLHIGNRYLSHSGLNLYDNTARMHDPLLMRFTTPDPLFDKYPDISPWSHCAANPVNAIDPSGMEFTETLNEKINLFNDEIDNKHNFYTNELLNSLLHGKGNLNKISKCIDNIFTCLDTRKEINVLRNSNQLYGYLETPILKSENIVLGTSSITGSFKMGSAGKIMWIKLGKFDMGLFAHEMKHAFQFETGSLGFCYDGSDFIYDQSDEKEAYKRGRFFGQTDDFNSATHSLYPHGPISIYDYINQNKLSINDLEKEAKTKNLYFRLNGKTFTPFLYKGE